MGRRSIVWLFAVVLMTSWMVIPIRGDDPTNDKPGAAADEGRVVIYSEDFEGAFPSDGWRRMGTVKENITQFDGAPKNGKHAAHFRGSPLADMEKWNGSIRRDVSTAGFKNIEISVSTGAKLNHPTEVFKAVCNPEGWYGKGKWHDLLSIKGGDEECDGKLRSYKVTLPEEMNDRPQFELLFVLYASDDPMDQAYVDDVVITGEDADGKRVTLFSDDFENELCQEWVQYSNLDPAGKAQWYAGGQKTGSHCVRLQGSPATNEDDFDCYFERIISTEGYEDIEVTLSMGTSGLDVPSKTFSFIWAEKGFYEKPFHPEKRIKWEDPENDAKLHRMTFKLSKEASDNPKFMTGFYLCGTNGEQDQAFLDDIVVTGKRIPKK